MRTKLLSIESFENTLAAPSRETDRESRRARQKTMATLRHAMQHELTARQRTCVELYFFERMTEEQVGNELGIGKATVCRHLQKAKKRLERVMRYTV